METKRKFRLCLVARSTTVLSEWKLGKFEKLRRTVPRALLNVTQSENTREALNNKQRYFNFLAAVCTNFAFV